MLFFLVFVCIFAREGVDDIINFVNQNEFGWKAEHNKFSTWPLEKLKRLCNCDLSIGKEPNIEEYVGEENDLPDNFDARQKWGSCIHPVRDQGDCGSCWAFGLTESLSDRFCIGGYDVILAPQDPVSCDPLNLGCNGGIPWVAWEYAEHDGIVEESCFPYVSGDGHVPKCPKTCVNGSKFKDDRFYAKSKKKVKKVDDIEDAIYVEGPVQVSFSVYEDFYQYSSGIYQHVSGGYVGGHVVEMIGWGVNGNGTDYWIVKNSWGSDWAMDGFFWILKGVDECGIEKNVYSPTPVSIFATFLLLLTVMVSINYF